MITTTRSSSTGINAYDGAGSFIYPVAFPNAALISIASPIDNANTLIETATANNPSQTGVTVRLGGTASGNAATAEMTGFALVIGY